MEVIPKTQKQFLQEARAAYKQQYYNEVTGKYELPKLPRHAAYGTHASAKKDIYNTYHRSVATIDRDIDKLREEKRNADNKFKEAISKLKESRKSIRGDTAIALAGNVTDLRRTLYKAKLQKKVDANRMTAEEAEKKLSHHLEKVAERQEARRAESRRRRQEFVSAYQTKYKRAPKMPEGERKLAAARKARERRAEILAEIGMERSLYGPYRRKYAFGELPKPRKVPGPRQKSYVKYANLL